MSKQNVLLFPFSPPPPSHSLSLSLFLFHLYSLSFSLWALLNRKQRESILIWLITWLITYNLIFIQCCPCPRSHIQNDLWVTTAIIKHNKRHCAVKKAEDVLHHYKNLMFRLFFKCDAFHKRPPSNCGPLGQDSSFLGPGRWEQLSPCFRSNMNRPFKTDMVTY